MDFTIEVERSLRVLDGAVAVFDGVAGVEPQSETVWRQANKYAVPRLCFLNKMDRMGANFYRCVDMIEKQLETVPLVLTLPIGTEASFVGVIDLVANTAIIWDNEELGAKYKVYPLHETPAGIISSELLDKAKTYRDKLIETIVDQDEEVMMQYLDGKTPNVDEIKRCIRRGTLSFSFTPILTGSAFKNKGIQPLLDAVIDYLPSPLDRPPISGVEQRNTSAEITRKSDDNEPLSALAFKLMNDPFVGTLTFIRIYSGILTTGSSVRNSVKNKIERVGRMLQMHANERTEVKEARSGDIVALVGLKDTTTGDTLCREGDPVPIILERMDFPEPVIKVAVEPKTKNDQEKMSVALNRLAKEDPSFRYSRQEDGSSGGGQTVIEGMGELHLEIIVDRMKREFKVECTVGEPQVAYKEALTSPALVEYIHKKQSGGAGQFAKVKIEFCPLAEESSEGGTASGGTESVKKTKNEGLVFENEIKGGVIPKEFIPGVEKGIAAVMGSGVIAGFPLVGLRARLLDGSYHDVDSSVLAFEIAGRAAAREGLRKGRSRLKEPVMKVDVQCPEEYLGDVIGDINSRRGQVLELGERGQLRTVSALVPLATMFQYVSTLRSLSRGRASYSMTLNSYEFVPSNVEKEIAAKYKPSVSSDEEDSDSSK